MVLIAQYDESLKVVGFLSEDKKFYDLSYQEELEALGHMITYKTQAELDAENQDSINEEIIRARKEDGEDYDLNGTTYKIPFMSEDANGLMQVNTAFTMGVASTNIHFSNGTVMPIVAADFQAFALWFVTKRNSFFL